MNQETKDILKQLTPLYLNIDISTDKAEEIMAISGIFNKHHVMALSIRQILVQRFGFFIPFKEAIDVISKYTPIIEVMAGTGYLGRLIKKKLGKNKKHLISMTDDYSWSATWKLNSNDVWKLDAVDAVRKYENRNVLMSWPYMDNNAYYVALNMEVGRYLIYIGESVGGCTATNYFFNYLDTKFEFIESVKGPVWRGIANDSVYVYKKIKK